MNNDSSGKTELKNSSRSDQAADLCKSEWLPFPQIPQPWGTVRNPECPSPDEKPDSYEFEPDDAFEEGPLELADAVYSLNNAFKAEAREARHFNRFDPRYSAHVRILMNTGCRIAQTIMTISKYQPERRSDPECAPQKIDELYAEFSYQYRKTAAAVREACQCGNRSIMDEMFVQQTDLLHLLTRLFVTGKTLNEKAAQIQTAQASDSTEKPWLERSRILARQKPVQARRLSESPRKSAEKAFNSIPSFPALKMNYLEYYEKNQARWLKEIAESKENDSHSDSSSSPWIKKLADESLNINEENKESGLSENQNTLSNSENSIVPESVGSPEKPVLLSDPGKSEDKGDNPQSNAGDPQKTAALPFLIPGLLDSVIEEFGLDTKPENPEIKLQQLKGYDSGIRSLLDSSFRMDDLVRLRHILKP